MVEQEQEEVGWNPARRASGGKGEKGGMYGGAGGGGAGGGGAGGGGAGGGGAGTGLVLDWYLDLV
ncbi:hypothetical protein HYALB_00010063 [Hymenoscyphus albidus]|uniref:Uncharacterized protein n=1 Tax=Hymenoscyphus albidus TaxID=595503 RepID=A0A9N9LU61_9HELO|nr:hypothetical protein HYALB_00010063 [Hymenoscyphus albidus]